MSARLAAAVAALVAWGALALQAWLIVERMGAEGASAAAALWRLVGFFTVLGNLAVAVVSTAIAVGARGRLAGPRVRLAVAVAIGLIGIVYSVALRHVWSPTGLQAVADHALHDAVPPLFLLAWLLCDHPGLRWRDAWWGLVPPLAYLGYALARGAVDGWYAYWFFDPTRLDVGRLAANASVLLVAFAAASLALVAADRALARRRRVGPTPGARDPVAAVGAATKE